MRSFAHGARRRRVWAPLMAAVALLVASPAVASLLSPSTLDTQIQQCIADIDPDSLFSYIEQLQGVVVDDVPEYAAAEQPGSRLREDVSGPALDVDEALGAAPARRTTPPACRRLQPHPGRG